MFINIANALISHSASFDIHAVVWEWQILKLFTNRNSPMSPDAYCKRFTSLNLTQEQAGELFGASARTG
jgi:hypothetical protein